MFMNIHWNVINKIKIDFVFKFTNLSLYMIAKFGEYDTKTVSSKNDII